MLLNNNTEEFLLQIKEPTMLGIIDNQLWQLLVCKLDTVALGRRAKFKADVFERYPFEEISSIGVTFLWILPSKNYPSETRCMWTLY